MWKASGKELDLEPAVPVGEDTYPGCGQEDVLAPQSIVEEKAEMFDKLSINRRFQKIPHLRRQRFQSC